MRKQKEGKKTSTNSKVRHTNISNISTFIIFLSKYKANKSFGKPKKHFLMPSSDEIKFQSQKLKNEGVSYAKNRREIKSNMQNFSSRGK